MHETHTMLIKREKMKSADKFIEYLRHMLLMLPDDQHSFPQHFLPKTPLMFNYNVKFSHIYVKSGNAVGVTCQVS